MTLDQFIREVRFRAECDALAEAFGEVPEGVMAYLRKGALVEAMEAAAERGDKERGFSFSLFVHPKNPHVIHGLNQLNQPSAKNPDAIFALFTEGTDFITKHEQSEALT